MRYLCLVYFDPRRMDALTESEGAALTRESLAYDESLRAKGRFLAAEALQPTAAAITVRMSGGKAMITDGPFAEAKEHLGGFILIEAASQAEAVEIAAGIPMARMGGGIEVRPILEISQ